MLAPLKDLAQNSIRIGKAMRVARSGGMFALVLGDYSLDGASESPAASSSRYWGQRLDDANGEWAIFELKNVPPSLHTPLLKHGTSDQEFSDGYDAWDAVKEFASPEPLEHGERWNR